MDYWKAEEEHDSVLETRRSDQDVDPGLWSCYQAGPFWKGLAIAGLLGLIFWSVLLLFIIS